MMILLRTILADGGAKEKRRQDALRKLRAGRRYEYILACQRVGRWSNS
jgi:hypothetical protein